MNRLVVCAGCGGWAERDYKLPHACGICPGCIKHGVKTYKTKNTCFIFIPERLPERLRDRLWFLKHDKQGPLLGQVNLLYGKAGLKK